MSSTIIPAFRYRDASAAINWLCTIFGFARQAVYPNPDNTIAHAQLTLGDGMIMLGTAKNDSKFGRWMRHPDETDGLQTHATYIVVPDADAVYARVQTAQTEILLPIADMPHGGREFSCRDLEGYIWSIGTYNPWAKPE